MASTYKEDSYFRGPWFSQGAGESLSDITTDRIYVEDDVVKLWRLAKGVVVVKAWTVSEELDAHATPTGTAVLELVDGGTTTTLLSYTTANLGATEVVRETDTFAGASVVTSSETAYIQFRVATAVATGQLCQIKHAITVSARAGGRNPWSPA